MVLLDNYFTLNKEQRQKFLTSEERKELREAKKLRKQQKKEENNENEEEVEEEEEEKQKKVKKSKKEKKEKIVELEVQEEEEEEEEEEVVVVKKSKKNKKDKKKQVIVEEQEQEKEEEQEQEKEEEEQIEKVEKKVKKQYGDNIDAEKWRKEHEMTISGNGCEDPKFHPFSTFNNTGMPENVISFVKQFAKPSPIQSQSWPILLNDRDCVAIAETGSGKTLGFLLPAFNHILKTTNDIQQSKFPRVVIVSPTRELATQIQAVCEEAQKKCGIKSVCVYGGVSKYEQKEMLKSGVQIVIGTPGRMKDLMQEGAIKTDQVSMMVLDEADRMLDMGFAPDIKFIFSQVKKQHQSVMFSATWPKEVQEIANQFIKDPLMIKIGTEEGTANKRVKQTVEVIKHFQRNARLQQLVKQYTKNREKVIIFVLYKAEAPRVQQLIEQDGHKVVALHGELSQKSRNLAFEQFKSGEANILVATDVAARGLDIPNVEYVINYSFPLTVSDYVHRIGRTGRAGKTGVAYTFFQEQADRKLAGDLCNILKESGQEINPELEKFGPTIHKRQQHSMYGDFYKEVDPTKKATKIKL